MASHERDKEYDDLSEETNIMSPKGSASESAFGVSSSGSSYFSSPSDFNSPFGSEIGSMENESEDDDFIAELSQLTRRMAEYTFQDDEDEFPKTFADTVAYNTEASGLSVKWPKSNSSSVYFCKEGFVNTSEKPNSDSGLAMKLNSEICPDQVLTDEQMKHIQVYQLKNQPQPKRQGLGHAGKREKGTEHVKESQNMQSKGGKAWRKRMMNPPRCVSQQGGSGMRAVFLRGSNTRSGSCGTGVFLPSGTFGAAEPKRKPGCSTVLIPARVLQTLQQHFNNVGAQSQSSNSSDGSTNSPWQNDVLARINGLLSQQKEHAGFQTWPALATNHNQEEVKLPQEWTY